MVTSGRVAVAAVSAAISAPIVVLAALLAHDALRGSIVTPQETLAPIVIIVLFGSLVAFLCIAIAAMPVYLVLRRHGPVRWWHAALTGAAIGALLAALVQLDLQGFALLIGTGVASGSVFRAVIGRDPRSPPPVTE